MQYFIPAVVDDGVMSLSTTSKDWIFTVDLFVCASSKRCQTCAKALNTAQIYLLRHENKEGITATYIQLYSRIVQLSISLISHHTGIIASVQA